MTQCTQINLHADGRLSYYVEKCRTDVKSLELNLKRDLSEAAFRKGASCLM